MSCGPELLLGADAAEDVHEGDQEDGGAMEDENSNQLDAVSLCRVCGDNLVGEKKPALKFSKPLPAAFSKLYGIDVTSEEDFLPSSLHRGCSQKIERAYKKVVKNSPGVSIPQLKDFMSRRQRKCTECN